MALVPTSDRPIDTNSPNSIVPAAAGPEAPQEPELTCCEKIVDILKTPKFYLLLAFLGLIVFLRMLLL